MTQSRLTVAGSLFFLSLIAYAVFSYALTAPNLTLINWTPYTQFQAWMWSTLFNNRPLLTYWYAGTITTVIGSYFFFLKELSSSSQFLLKKTKLQLILGLGIFLLPLFLSVNALSYDVFNYIFNAKMVLVYHADPHVKVALDFAADPWVRFMHNTHTPAPYGYGWTALSLLPYMLGAGKFLLTWEWFRVMSVLSLAAMISVWLWVNRQSKAPSLLTIIAVTLNPLLLIEVVGNFHNDLWMMAPAVLSLALVAPERKKNIDLVLVSATLLIFSVSIKLATLALVPLWLLLLTSEMKIVLPWTISLWKKRATLLQTWWPVWASLLMFIPLLTSRSQQFHPWYLTWVLAWVPLFPVSKNRWLIVWQMFICSLSVSSLFRYLPYLGLGYFTPEVIVQQKLITWLPALTTATMGFFLLKRRNPAK